MTNNHSYKATHVEHTLFNYGLHKRLW